MTRLACPALDEPIVDEGKQLDQVYSVYGFDTDKKVWLVSNEHEDTLYEVERAEAVYDGSTLWQRVRTAWVAEDYRINIARGVAEWLQ